MPVRLMAWLTKLCQRSSTTARNPVQIVRYARTATSDSPVFFILAAGQSGITDVEQLKGVEIGVSKGTIIEYLTDRLLQAEGFNNDEINTIAVPISGNAWPCWVRVS